MPSTPAILKGYCFGRPDLAWNNKKVSQ